MKELKKILGLVFITLLVAGCGGGSSSDNNVPPVDENVIAGEDTNNNGVWDYLDEYIEKTYPGQENEKLREALKENALVEQEFLLAETKEQAVAAARKRESAISKLGDIYSDWRDTYKTSKNFEKALLNTYERVKKYYENDLKLSGEFF